MMISGEGSDIEDDKTISTTVSFARIVIVGIVGSELIMRKIIIFAMQYFVVNASMM